MSSIDPTTLLPFPGHDLMVDGVIYRVEVSPGKYIGYKREGRVLSFIRLTGFVSNSYIQIRPLLGDT